MMMDFSEVNQLQETEINTGDHWIFSADFNIGLVNGKLESTSRIDSEISDLKYILGNKGVVVILAHKGRHPSSLLEKLDFVVPYLESQLETKVDFYPKNITDSVVEAVRVAVPGSVLLMANTRNYYGEEGNNKRVANTFSKLGDKVAIGGFGKAHRVNASNVGILENLPGYLTQSQVKEMKNLEPWSVANDASSFSVAAIGGLKKEKIITGLVGFADSYDIIIPGGIVLNTIMKVKRRFSSNSIFDNDVCENAVEKVLEEHTGKICLPDSVIVAKYDGRKFYSPEKIKFNDKIPKDYLVIDSILSGAAEESLDRMVEEGGRLVLAGSLGACKYGFTDATDKVLTKMNQNRDNCIILGGDTTGELSYDGPFSNGGGSALYFLVHGTTPVFEALKRQKLGSHW